MDVERGDSPRYPWFWSFGLASEVVIYTGVKYETRSLTRWYKCEPAELPRKFDYYNVNEYRYC